MVKPQQKAEAQPRGQTDWTALDALTDEDIQRAIDLDPDSAPALSYEDVKAQVDIRPVFNGTKRKIGVTSKSTESISLMRWTCSPGRRSTGWIRAQSYGETRINSLGELDARILNVTHTDRDGETRLSSARRANAVERKRCREFHHASARIRE